VLLPDEHAPLRAGDTVLFAGEAGIEGLQRRTLADTCDRLPAHRPRAAAHLARPLLAGRGAQAGGAAP